MTVEAVICCAPLAAPALSDEEAEATAALFRALGDPGLKRHRQAGSPRIVNKLATSDGAVCICDLIEPLGLTQPTVSHHMKKLLDVGLVEREQRGRWAFFNLKAEALQTLALVADVKEGCC